MTGKHNIEMAVKQLNTRFDYIDVAKGLGMLFIIWGHVASGQSVVFFYSFHIPLFFFLSGMVFSPDRYPSFARFIQRKFQTLILPYVVYSVVTWIVWLIFSYFSHIPVKSYWSPLLQTLIAQGSEGYLVHNVPLWFVPCLFVVEIAYYWISRLPELWNVVVCLLLAASSYLLVNYCSLFDFTLLPWSIDVAMAAIPFYALGFLSVKHIGYSGFEDFVKKNVFLSVLAVIALFVIVYWGAMFNTKVSMGHAILHNPFVFYPIACFGVVATLTLSLLISHCLSKRKIVSGIKWFGRNSFDAMAIHNPVKGVVIVVLAYLLKSGKLDIMRSPVWAMVAFLMVLFTTIICMMGVQFIKRSKK